MVVLEFDFDVFIKNVCLEEVDFDFFDCIIVRVFVFLFDFLWLVVLLFYFGICFFFLKGKWWNEEFYFVCRDWIFDVDLIDFIIDFIS